MSSSNGKRAEAARLSSPRHGPLDPRERELIEEVAVPLRERAERGEALSAEESRIVARADKDKIYEPEREAELPQLDRHREVVAARILERVPLAKDRDEQFDRRLLLRVQAREEALRSKAGVATQATLEKLQRAEADFEQADAALARAMVEETRAAQALDAARRRLLAERGQ